MTTTPDQPSHKAPDRYARRNGDEWHIYPDNRHGVTTCGARLGQYVATRVVKELPPMSLVCPVCVDWHNAGRQRPVKSKQRRPS